AIGGAGVVVVALERRARHADAHAAGLGAVADVAVGTRHAVAHVGVHAEELRVRTAGVDGTWIAVVARGGTRWWRWPATGRVAARDREVSGQKPHQRRAVPGDGEHIVVHAGQEARRLAAITRPRKEPVVSSDLYIDCVAV